MTVVNNSAIVIKNLDNEGYNLGSITADPRAVSALDIKAGLDNLVIDAPDGVNDLVLSLVHYLFHDYFAFAHQSGLYNRQIRLWEMFSRISRVEVRQLERGLFSKTLLPVYEVVMKTAQGQSPICALVISRQITDFEPYKHQTNHGAGKVYVELLRDFLLKVMKIQARLGANGVKGIFIVTPAPLEEALSAYIEKETRASDPVSKAESIMPAPVSAHINLLTYSAEGEESYGDQAATPIISLSYPNISRRSAVSTQR